MHSAKKQKRKLLILLTRFYSHRIENPRVGGSIPPPATILRFAQNGEIAQTAQRQPFHCVKMREPFPKLQFPVKNDPKIKHVVLFHRIAARSGHHFALRAKWRDIPDRSAAAFSLCENARALPEATISRQERPQN